MVKATFETLNPDAPLFSELKMEREAPFLVYPPALQKYNFFRFVRHDELIVLTALILLGCERKLHLVPTSRRDEHTSRMEEILKNKDIYYEITSEI